MIADSPIVTKKQVKRALKALRLLLSDVREERKKSLLEDSSREALFLQVQLKKIPATRNIKRIKVTLPHSRFDEHSDVCVIAGDLDKRNRKAEVEPDKLHYKEIFKKNGVENINEVITLRELRTEYKPFEAKLKLLGAYDVFLADNRIVECLPKLLGRHFFVKRKFPLGFDLKSSNLKHEIDRTLSKIVFQVSGQGNTCTSEVGRLDMPDQEIAANVMALVEALSKQLPGSLHNIMGLYLKTKKSKALPIYVSFGDPGKVKVPKEIDAPSFETDELSTLPTGLVKVFSDGKVELLEDANPEGSDISDGSEEDVLQQSSKKRKIVKESRRKDSKKLSVRPPPEIAQK